MSFPIPPCNRLFKVSGTRQIAPLRSEQAREHEVDRGVGGIDGSVEIALTALDTNAGLTDAPGLVGWLEMTSHPPLQFGSIALDPGPDCAR